MRRLRQELEQVVGNREDISREDVKQMSYLGYMLRETLRLYPSVPVNTRTAHKTTVLPTGGGPDGRSPVLIRKGQNVAYLVYGMHRRKDLFGEDAESFRPERWENPGLPLYADKSKSAWGYLPFNGGPRVCLGQDFGLMEASYAVIRILQAFSRVEAAPYDDEQTQAWDGWSSHHGRPCPRTATDRQKMTLVMSLADGCPVFLRR